MLSFESFPRGRQLSKTCDQLSFLIHFIHMLSYYRQMATHNQNATNYILNLKQQQLSGQSQTRPWPQNKKPI